MERNARANKKFVHVELLFFECGRSLFIFQLFYLIADRPNPHIDRFSISWLRNPQTVVVGRSPARLVTALSLSACKRDDGHGYGYAAVKPHLHLLCWDHERRFSDRLSRRKREPDPQPAESLERVESCPG